MKKILALAALMAVAPAFAAQNTFTFQVNSSGAEMYVCGFSVRNSNANTNYARNNGGNMPAYTGSSVTWTEQLVDTWDGTVSKTQTLTKDLKPMSTISRNFSAQLVGSIEEFHRIRDLTINLSDEYYGVAYDIQVCYNVPLFYDLSKVDFNVKMNSQFDNMTIDARDYLTKAKVSTDMYVVGAIIDGNRASGSSHTGMEEGDIVSGNLTFESTAVMHDIPTLPNEAVLIATYSYRENSAERRPHVKHGGTFVVNTEIVPVAKSADRKDPIWY